MYRLNLFILSEIANNSNSVCIPEWTKYWVFDSEFNYGADIDVQAYRNQQWLDEMESNCKEYLPYEEQYGFVPLDEEDFDTLGF